MKRSFFDKEYIRKEFDKIASKISTPLTLFMIGGGGLSFYGLKEATKDIDVVVQNQKELKTLIKALKNSNYRPVGIAEISITYRKIGAQKILENEDGFRWDIFVQQVCRALTVSHQMKSRATPLYKKGFLEVLLASKEDIFLFKGITEREADLDDMRLLAESGLNWKVIEQECHAQSAASGRLWENALYERLVDLREKHNIESPIEKTLKTILEEKLVEITLIEAIKQGNDTIKTISQAIKEPEHFVRKSLKKLLQKGRIKVNKSSRPYKFVLNS